MSEWKDITNYPKSEPFEGRQPPFGYAPKKKKRWHEIESEIQSLTDKT
jgi:hypothetical protein